MKRCLTVLLLLCFAGPLYSVEDPPAENKRQTITIKPVKQEELLKPYRKPPKVIWNYIFSFLSTKSKYQMSQTCSFFYGISHNDQVWRETVEFKPEQLAKLDPTTFPLCNINILKSKLTKESEDIRSILHLKNLRILDLKGVPELDNSFLDTISKTLTNIIELKVRGEKLKGSALGFMNSGLKSLHFQSAQLTNQDSSHFKRFTNLTDLSLWKTQGIMFNELATLTQLTTLDLPRVDMGDGNLSFFSKLIKLKDVRLASNKITDVGLDKLTHLNGLKVLHLGYNNVTEEGLKRILPFFPVLEELSIVSIPLISENPIDFSKFLHLTTLNLSETNATAKHMNFSPRLAQLDLYYVPFDREKYEMLKYVTTLTQLSLSKKNLTEEKIADELSKNFVWLKNLALI